MLGKLQWDRRSFILHHGELDPMSYSTVDALIRDHVYNVQTFIRRNVCDSKERFLKFCELISRTGKFPAPIILVRTNGLFRLMDGNHRYSALLALGQSEIVPVDAWIGTLDNKDISSAGEPHNKAV